MFECAIEQAGGRPAWPGFPDECRNHHPWEPGAVVIDWRPCDCPAAIAARGGHIEVTCGTPSCTEVWQRPRHEPFRLPKILGHHRPGHLASAGSVGGPGGGLAAFQVVTAARMRRPLLRAQAGSWLHALRPGGRRQGGVA